MLTGLLASAGLAPRVAKFASIAIIVLAALGALWWWGHSRYQAGATATDAKWKAAQSRLVEQAAAVRSKADSEAVHRMIDHSDKVEKEKEKLDEAERNGSSPFDVLFGPGGVR